MEEYKLINMIKNDFRKLIIIILNILLNSLMLFIIWLIINRLVLYFFETRNIITINWILIIDLAIATLIYLFLTKRIKRNILTNKTVSKTFLFVRKILISLSFISILIGIVYNTIKIINYKEPTKSEKELFDAINKMPTLDVNEMDSIDKIELEKAIQDVLEDDNE